MEEDLAYIRICKYQGSDRRYKQLKDQRVIRFKKRQEDGRKSKDFQTAAAGKKDANVVAPNTTASEDTKYGITIGRWFFGICTRD